VIDMELLIPLFEKFGKDLSPGRMFESVLLLTIIWSKLKPHLKKIEDRLGGVENAVQTGFASGKTRFEMIENRLKVLEENKEIES
jgi:hypothetical protein